MRYVQLSRAPGRVKIILSRVLAAAAALCIYCVFQEKGMYFRCRWPEELLPAGREARLRELQRLYDQQLITKEDYDQKRQEILKEL